MDDKALCVCGKPVKIDLYKSRQGKTCGAIPCRNEQRRRTNFAKHGHINSLHGEMGREKVRETLTRKYGAGIKNISQLKEVKEAKKKTCFRNFGVEHPMQSAEVRAKSVETVRAVYGVDNISKTPEIKKAISSALRTVEPESGLTPSEMNAFRQHNHYMRKYGVHLFCTEAFKENYKKQMLLKYNADNFFKTDAFRQMMIASGRQLSEEEIAAFNAYSILARRKTRKTYNRYFDSLLNKAALDPRQEYHLDHIYSIADGFQNLVPLDVISSVINLQFLTARENHLKWRRSWITLDELNKRYQHYQGS